MKKTNRIFCIIALFSIIALTISGCNKTGSNRDSSKNVGGLAPATLTWYQIGNKQIDDAIVFEEFNKIVKEKINATVKFEIIDTGAYNDKMNLVLASGQDIDLCFASNWTNKFYPNVAKGAFLELDKLLETKAPALKKSLPDFVWDGVKVNEKIYAVPNYQVLYRQNTQIVTKELADKYGLKPENVKTVKDLEPFLEKVKQNEPMLYPFQNFFNVEYSYEAIKPTDVVIKKDETGYTVYNKFETQEYKDFLNIKRDFFKKGYIRSDIATVSNDLKDVEALKYAVMYSTSKPGMLPELKSKYKKDFIEIPMDQPYLESDAGTSSLIAIAKNSKNAERAIMLLEMINTDKALYNLKCFGIEGVHYDKISENQIKVKDGSKYNAVNGANEAWKNGNQFNAFYTDFQTPGIYEETIKLNEQSKKSKLRGFVFDTEPVKNELSQIATVRKEFISLLNTGSVEIEPTYSKFLEKYKKVGADIITQEVQRQVNEWLKNKK